MKLKHGHHQEESHRINVDAWNQITVWKRHHEHESGSAFRADYSFHTLCEYQMRHFIAMAVEESTKPLAIMIVPRGQTNRWYYIYLTPSRSASGRQSQRRLCPLRTAAPISIPPDIKRPNQRTSMTFTSSSRLRPCSSLPHLKHFRLTLLQPSQSYHYQSHVRLSAAAGPTAHP